MKKTKRIVYRVQWNKIHLGWVVMRGKFQTSGIPTLKRDAVEDARRYAKTDWRSGKLAQVVIHGKDGKIQKEWTYGKDPRRTRG